MSAPLNLNPTPVYVSSSPANIAPSTPGMLAQSTYDELRTSGLSDVDIMAFAGELLSLVASGVRRQPQS